MKVLFRLIMFVSTVIVAMLAVIKFTRRCSWVEAAGILDELWKDMRASCPCCSGEQSDSEK